MYTLWCQINSVLFCSVLFVRMALQNHRPNSIQGKYRVRALLYPNLTWNNTSYPHINHNPFYF